MTFLISTDWQLPVYQKVEEAVGKHPDADVVVNFASSRSAYSSTLELMNYPQIKVYN
jgi:ATP citrate (pro-S)-lyase